MNAAINERVNAWPAVGDPKGTDRIELVPDHVRDVLNLRRLPARLTVPQTAALLNCGDHDVPVLVAKGLLRPLGHPPPNVVKYFAPTEVLGLAGDSDRMGQICDTLHDHWREKNARKSNGNSHSGVRKLNGH
jgi:hypothetical protein